MEKLNTICGYCIPCPKVKMRVSLRPGTEAYGTQGEVTVTVQMRLLFCKEDITCTTARKATRIPTGPWKPSRKRASDSGFGVGSIGTSFIIPETKLCIGKKPTPFRTGMSVSFNFLTDKVCCKGLKAKMTVEAQTLNDAGELVGTTASGDVVKPCSPCCELMFDRSVDAYWGHPKAPAKAYYSQGGPSDECYVIELINKEFNIKGHSGGYPIGSITADQAKNLMNTPAFNHNFQTTIWNMLGGVWDNLFHDSSWGRVRPPGRDPALFYYNILTISELGCKCPPQGSCCT